MPFMLLCCTTLSLSNCVSLHCWTSFQASADSSRALVPWRMLRSITSSTACRNAAPLQGAVQDRTQDVRSRFCRDRKPLVEHARVEACLHGAFSTVRGCSAVSNMLMGHNQRTIDSPSSLGPPSRLSSRVLVI